MLKNPEKLEFWFHLEFFFKPRSYNELNSDFMHEFFLLFYFPSN